MRTSYSFFTRVPNTTQVTLGVCIALLWSSASWAQRVTGVVSDSGGEPLGYVTIGVAGSDVGVTSSDDGRYAIDLGGDGGKLQFRSIGFAVSEREVSAGTEAVRLDVRLEPATYTLDEATVSSGGEDPAYRIMREAAARREGYLRADARYEVDVYLKGQLRMAEAPEKIMGQELGDLNGLLDSNRAGILYLSEARSILQVEPPNKVKETVVASKVSGDPRGYSFNTAAGLEFDLYQRTVDFGKTILSPLATGAPQTYTFSLDGSRRSPENGRLIYRIGIRPRRPSLAAYAGTLYVEDESFHLLDADLYLLGGPIQANGIDTLGIAQSYREVDGNWEVYQRRVEPYFNLLGFVLTGDFTAVYSDYDRDPDWPESPFGRVVTEVLPEANEVDSASWEDRPIALTAPEVRDYERKDSIRRVRTSPVYRDSVQAARNEFGVDALFGYTYSDWRKHTSWNFTSPLLDLAFHPVTGLRLGAGVAYTKESDELATRAYSVGGLVRYGVADRCFYPTASLSYRFDRTDRRTLTLRGGRELTDYHRAAPVTERWNELYNLWGKRNLMKLYQRDFVAIGYTAKLRRPGTMTSAPPWADLNLAVEIEQRRARDNRSDLSLRKKDRTYAPNLPEVGDRSGVYDTIPNATFAKLSGRISYTPGLRYSVRPDGNFALGGGGPELTLSWRYGRELSGGAEGAEPVEFLFLQAGARKDEFNLGRVGRLGMRVGAGFAPVYRGPRYLTDQQLFTGNRLNVNGISDYLSRFLTLAPYDFATDGAWVDGMVEHNFNGLLWQRLPLLRKLGWQVLLRGGGILLADGSRSYAEVGAGLTNVGFGAFRFFRFDVAYREREGEWANPYWVLGINLPFEALVGAAGG